MHHNFDDSEGDYDMDMDQKGGRSFGVGGYKGRIIFLGDGTEVLTDSDDTEMFDNAEEDKDLESQVSRDSTAAAPKDGEAEGEASSTTEQSSAAAAGEKKGQEGEQAGQQAEESSSEPKPTGATSDPESTVTTTTTTGSSESKEEQKSS